ncbi:MAG: phosphoadenosine phosphosulfate reductase family protein [Chloroflexota bacterium]
MKPRPRQVSLFDDQRLRLPDAIDLSLDSLRHYGPEYRHWALAFSGGKDSTATVTFVAWAILTGKVPAPESLTILYGDTRMELPPLQATAMQLLARLERDGFETQVVQPPMDARYMIYMLGYGVPPSSNTFRWCTPKLKIEPMHAALRAKREAAGEKLLMLTGVRLGESEARDQRIAVSCSKNSGECGQGWFQVATPESVADTLAPLLHWRLCHVFDWLYFETPRHGYDQVAGIADVYGQEEVRTGCVGCPLASRDVALERLLKNPDWTYLTPLMELKPLYRELKKPKHRIRKARPERRKDGQWSRNGQRMGPLTMEARAYGLETVLDIQHRVNHLGRQDGRLTIDLINDEEEARIREMWAQDTWPQKWSGDEVKADVLIDQIDADGDRLIVQPVLVR